MIDLSALLPAHIIEQCDEQLSVLCVQTSEIKYLIFGTNASCPLYVVQTGDFADLQNIFENTTQLYTQLPDCIPEPLYISERDKGRGILVQRGLAGRPWFTLRDELTTLNDWQRIKKLSVDALHRFHTASAMSEKGNLSVGVEEEFVSVRTHCQHIVGQFSHEQSAVLDEQQECLATLGSISCHRQHGDFGVNNLLFDGNRAGIIDFEQYGRVFQPLHDEFLLAGSLLELHPQRDKDASTSLWNQIIQGSTYRDQLTPHVTQALFVMSLMWWITETNGKEQRLPMAKRYKQSLQHILSALAQGDSWTPAKTII